MEEFEKIDKKATEIIKNLIEEDFSFGEIKCMGNQIIRKSYELKPSPDSVILLDKIAR